MIARSIAPTVVLAAVAAATALTASAPTAGAALAPEAASVSSANAVESAAAYTYISLTRFDRINQDETRTVTVNVPVAGTYAVQYGVTRPETAGLLRTVVGGKQLADTAAAAAPGTFVAIVQTESFQLAAGSNTFEMTGVKVPSDAGVGAALVAANIS
jgi:hypothetical protein